MQEQSIILSICIPTFNRSEQLKELIDSVLSLERQDFEVVVTDNVSTDDTIAVLENIHAQDDRLRICRNKMALPGLCNMIEAIFNANGKYALYCNDRDLLFADEIEKLMAFLEKDEFSFVQTKQKMAAKRAKCSDTVSVYPKGYESLMHHRHTHHPTGMVFNCEIIRKFLNKEKYFQYLPLTFTYSFLMRDLLQYEKSAVYDYGCWAQRHPMYLRANKSGIAADWYLPSTYQRIMEGVMIQIFKECNFELTKKQSVELTKYIMLFFAKNIWGYKAFMMDEYQPAHYGLKRQFVSTLEMLKISHDYSNSSICFLQENKFPKEFAEAWKNNLPQYYLSAIRESLRSDLVMIKRRTFAVINHLFPKAKSDIA